MVTTYTRPDTYLSEVLAPAVNNTGNALSVACLVGTNARGPAAATQVTSWGQFTNLYGNFIVGTVPSDLQYAAWLFFQNGGSSLWVIRVLQGTELTAAATLLDREAGGSAQVTLTISAVNPGTWGNSLSYGISDSSATGYVDLTIFYKGQVLETFRTLTLDPTDPQYLPRVVNSPAQGSLVITATQTATYVGTPSLLNQLPAVTGTGSGSSFVLIPVTLAGGTDQSAPPATGQWTAAMSLADPIGTPLLLNLPGITSSTLVSAAIAYAEGRGDTFVVDDAITTVSSVPPTAALQVTAAAGYLNGGALSSYHAPYYPRLVIADPASTQPGATRVVGQGGAIMGKFVQTDASIGVQQVPAGTQFGRLNGVIGTEVPVSDADASLLNPLGINAIRTIPGSGVCLFGARTGRQVGQADKHISVRRTLIYVKSSLKVATRYALFQPNNVMLWASVIATCSQFLTGLWTAGTLAGDSVHDAYFVTVDNTNNTPTTVANGELHINVGIAPLVPAEFIVFQISQFNGAVSISES